MEGLTAEAAPGGLAQVYVERRGELLRFLTARVGDAAEAEDLLQELWIRIQAADIGPVANGRAYLYRAAQNLVLDRVTARKRRAARESDWAAGARAPIPGPEPADPAKDAEATLIEREETALLASAIAALPEAAGRAFRLHKLDGLPHAEVAARLGISRSGVEKHIALAMVHLRRALRG
ncbi:RNA polymerase sigma factor [Roseomonas aeriglobus]|nr:RNA polymerase sigma factor [Roseomonas aeriglobus]